jgi:hypothetical protein
VNHFRYFFSPSLDIRQYSLPPNTFLPYSSPQAQFIDPHLYAQVSGFNLFPYEYGRVTIIGNSTRIGKKFDPTTLTLHNIASNTGTIDNKWRGKKGKETNLLQSYHRTNPSPFSSSLSCTDILRSLIVQDPSQGETGAAFLLASIATFGDSKAGIPGEVAGTDWQDWWTSVLSYL